MRKFRMLAALLCVAVFVCGFSVTAYAKAEDYPEETSPDIGVPAEAQRSGFGGERRSSEMSELSPQAEASDMELVTTREGLDPAEETTAPTEQDGEFTEDGSFLTRDLLYDEHTNKQFITVQTSGGSTFYIVIDYDKPVDEDGEQYQTYFFSVVDEADLLAAMQAAGMEVPTCACTDKCMAGAINTACPVCATNMTECAGAAPVQEPTADPEPVVDPDPEQPEAESNTGTIILIAAVALIGGVAAWYFKIYRPKKEAAQPEEDYEEPDYGGYADEDDAAWDEEDGV